MINITYSCKDVNEVKELLLFQKENSLDEKINLNLNKTRPKSEEKIKKNKIICEKCWSEKRFIKWWTRTNWSTYSDFYTCDHCNPRIDWKFTNKQWKNNTNNPESIYCPDCWNFIRKQTSQYWDYYKCSCWYKLDSRSDDFKNLTKEYEY